MALSAITIAWRAARFGALRNYLESSDAIKSTLRGAIGPPWVDKLGTLEIGRGTVCELPRLGRVRLSVGPRGTLTLGTDCRLNYATVVVAHERVTIGNRVEIGERCVICDTGLADAKIDDIAIEPRPIVIHDDVWLAARVVVMPGVEIGARTVVAAGSVVADSLPADVLAGGIPARPIRALSKDEIKIRSSHA
jgi:acetyltransferase-like isoleucine patch superfamily enzyme